MAENTQRCPLLGARFLLCFLSSHASLDSGILIALGLALFAAVPFISRPGLPHQTDAELHVYRAAELGHVIRDGIVYSRWAPDLYLGYGYPIFNYYAPFTYYLANLFAFLPGIGIVCGVKAVFVSALVLASVGTYLLGRELFGPAAGVLAAASFTFAPYVVFVDPHARGDLAEHFAISLLPLGFYFFHRLMSVEGGPGAVFGGALTLAILVLSHNLLGLVAGVLLLAFWTWGVAVGGNRRRAWWGSLTFALAVAITAFFWLPAVWERSAVKLDVTGPGHFDFRGHFLSLRELLAPSRILDLGAAAPRYRYNLGLPQWMLGLSALMALLRPGLSDDKRWALLFFLLAVLGLALLMLPVSKPVWERVPGMSYLQFPWRLLGPANLMLAMCSAGGVSLLPDGRWRAPAVSAGLAVILLMALPLLYPPTWTSDFGSTSAQDIIRWEMKSQALGTTSTGDFLPVEAALVPIHPVQTLVDSYAEPGPVDKINRATLPQDTEVEVVEHGPLQDRFDVSTGEKFVLRLYTFYFPGWHAYVDGREVDIEVAGPEGFITLWVPKGDHEVVVRFEDTPPRTAGWVISGLGSGALIAVLALMSRSRSGIGRREAVTCGLRSAFWLGGTLALIVLVKNVVVDPRSGWLRYTSAPGQALAAQHRLSIDFEGKIELIGYDLPRKRFRPGATVPVVLYWHAATPLDRNYQSFLHLTRPRDVLWSQEDHLNPGGLPTTRWSLDKYVWDEYEIRIPQNTPPGRYTLSAGLYLRSEGYRLRCCSGEGDRAVVASIEVIK